MGWDSIISSGEGFSGCDRFEHWENVPAIAPTTEDIDALAAGLREVPRVFGG